MTELRASTGAVTALGGQLDNVAADVGAVVNGAPALSEVLNSHGTIGFPADFEGASEARSAAVGATKAVSERMAETLRQAANAYERGDLEAAEKLKAQADRMAGGRSSGSANAATGGPDGSGAGGGQDGGMQAGGQMMGQFSQMAGQMMQGITQPVQGIVQGVSQVPQQVMQGVQGIVQAATQGAAGGAGGLEASLAGAGQPDGAGAPAEGEKAPAQVGIMSEERMRELQGQPPLLRDAAPHGPPPESLPRDHPRTARDL
ncbi:type VII secretion target [Mycolicibacterium lutetiense]